MRTSILSSRNVFFVIQVILWVQMESVRKACQDKSNLDVTSLKMGSVSNVQWVITSEQIANVNRFHLHVLILIPLHKNVKAVILDTD